MFAAHPSDFDSVTVARENPFLHLQGAHWRYVSYTSGFIRSSSPGEKNIYYGMDSFFFTTKGIRIVRVKID